MSPPGPRWSQAARPGSGDRTVITMAVTSPKRPRRRHLWARPEEAGERPHARDGGHDAGHAGHRIGLAEVGEEPYAVLADRQARSTDAVRSRPPVIKTEAARAVRAPPYPRPGARRAPGRYPAPPRGRRSARPRHVDGLEERTRRLPAGAQTAHVRDRRVERGSQRAGHGERAVPERGHQPRNATHGLPSPTRCCASGFGAWGRSRSLQPLGCH
jgi:hypothetical protein